MVKTLRTSYDNNEAKFPTFSVLIGQKSMYGSYCLPNVKDGIQIQVYNINNECVTHCRQFISIKL